MGKPMYILKLHTRENVEIMENWQRKEIPNGDVYDKQNSGVTFRRNTSKGSRQSFLRVV